MQRSNRTRYVTAAAVAVLGLSAYFGAARSAVAAGPDGAWVKLLEQTLGPFGRDGVSATFDSRRGRPLMVGGSFRGFFHGPILGYDNQTWALDLRGAGAWQRVALTAYTPPMTVERGAVAYDSLLDQAWAFGGAHYDAFSGTIDRYEGGLTRLDLTRATPAWESLSIPGPNPPARFGHSLVLDPARRRLVLFGGRGADGHARSDVWTYDVDGVSGWTLLTPAGAPPAARDLHAVIVDPGRNQMLVLGGTGESNEVLNDAWTLDLGATPTWTPMSTTGTYPGGAAPAVYDARDDRVLVLAGASSVVLYELALGPAPAWRALAPAGTPPPRANAHFAATIDPVTHEVADLGSYSYAFPAYESHLVTYVLHLDPLPVVHLSATLAPRFTFGTSNLDWNVSLDRPLYGPIAIERLDPGGPVWLANRDPDALGRFSHADIAPVPGGHYDYRLRWFDGAASQVTPALGIDAPPAPIALTVTLESLLLRGDRVYAQWSVPEDSAQWLAPTCIEQSLASAPWVRVATTYPYGGHIPFSTDAVPPETLVRYRLTWGPNLDDYASPPVEIATLPVPTLVGYAGNAVSAVVEWRYPPGLPLQATASVLYYNGWGPLEIIRPDAGGILHFEDVNVAPDNFVTYRLGWDVGGATRFTPDVNVVISSDATRLLQLVAADSAAVTLAWSYPDLDTQRLLQLERRDAGAWAGLATLAPVPAAQRRYVDLTAEAHQRYWYRVRWPTGGVLLRSDSLVVDVLGGPPATPAFTLGRAAPNPAADAFEVALSLPDDRVASLSLFDLAGRLVRRQEVSGTTARTVRFGTEGLPSGIYLLRLSHPTASRVERVVLIH